MGYISDEHLILECYDRETLAEIRQYVIELLDEEEEIQFYDDYIQMPNKQLANGGFLLYIPADGSKEGWSTSNAMDDIREKLIKHIIKQNETNKDWHTYISIIKVVDDEGRGLSVESVL